MKAQRRIVFSLAAAALAALLFWILPRLLGSAFLNLAGRALSCEAQARSVHFEFPNRMVVRGFRLSASSQPSALLRQWTILTGHPTIEFDKISARLKPGAGRLFLKDLDAAGVDCNLSGAGEAGLDRSVQFEGTILLKGELGRAVVRSLREDPKTFAAGYPVRIKAGGKIGRMTWRIDSPYLRLELAR